MTARRTRRVSAILAAGLFATACGGGGGGGSSVPPGTVAGGGAGGSGGGSPSTPAEPVSKINTETDAARFLARATFGGSKAEIASLTGRDAADWIASEFNKSTSLTTPALLALPRDSQGNVPRQRINTLYWDHVIGANDQLRQRMAFALSQILVYSDAADSDQPMRAYYQDIMIRNAFGNYRDLLEEVTYSSAMGEWLTYRGNRKGDPSKGRMPDENYAREILQLFSIGLIELNLDGSPKLDGQGNQIETYSNADIEGLARVFTGLSWAGGEFFKEPQDGNIQPMQMYPEHHSELEKVFLGTTIPAGTPGEETIDTALDTIFNHPNVAPFVSRQLIQRFTQSNPSPAYIQRVATAFEAGTFTAQGGQRFGDGRRGDLQATLAAILLDPSVFAEPGDGATITVGKVREPILRFTNWARAFDVSGLDAYNERRLLDTRSTEDALGQQAFRSPSVFNFYRPGYVAPGTNAGEANLTVPEFQIVNESTSVGYLNFMTDFAFDRASQRNRDIETYTPDYSDELALVDDPQALVDHLDNLLTGGRMSAAEKADIVDIISTVAIRTNNPENTAADQEDMVQTAVTLVLNSPSYAVTW
ncbi:MAG: DUF1800 domain-containing protein [Hyphomonadaceae bacterium]|nr:DUF1800 domain-containing protein [Hyphomonadaceae bacterium]